VTETTALIIVFGLPLIIGVYFVVIRLMNKRYYDGWLAGFHASLEINRKMDERAHEYAEIIRKEDVN
jgi:hypothetical protein